MRGTQAPYGILLLMKTRELSQAELLRALRARAGVRHSLPPRLVLAFYYGWYGAPEVSGKWLHWDGVDAERQQIATSTHYPVLGAYDSNDPKVIEQHCRWAREAGLDGFIYSWWGIDGYEEKPLARLLDTAQRQNLKVCLYYEQVPQPRDPRSVLPDLRHILRQFAKHPAYLKVAGTTRAVCIRARDGATEPLAVGVGAGDHPRGVPRRNLRDWRLVGAQRGARVRRHSIPTTPSACWRASP
jgi:hypothetical protein